MTESSWRKAVDETGQTVPTSTKEVAVISHAGKEYQQMVDCMGGYPGANYVAVTYPDTVTEVYTFSTSSGGTVVGTTTVVYTTATKDVLLNVTMVAA